MSDQEQPLEAGARVVVTGGPRGFDEWVGCTGVMMCRWIRLEAGRVMRIGASVVLVPERYDRVVVQRIGLDTGEAFFIPVSCVRRIDNFEADDDDAVVVGQLLGLEINSEENHDANRDQKGG